MWKETVPFSVDDGQTNVRTYVDTRCEGIAMTARYRVENDTATRLLPHETSDAARIAMAKQDRERANAVGLAANVRPRIATRTEASHALDREEPETAGAASAGLLFRLQQMGQAAAILDKFGLVIGLNALAEQHMRHAVILNEGRLLAAARDANSRLQALIRSLIEPADRADPDLPAVVVLPGADGHALVLKGTPISCDSLGRFGILTFTDIHKATLPRAAVLRHMFGLTSSEASIALAVANGDDTRAIAAQRGVSVDTVRTHLKAVFGKTNTRRQVSLAVLIARIQGTLASN